MFGHHGAPGERRSPFRFPLPLRASLRSKACLTSPEAKVRLPAFLDFVKTLDGDEEDKAGEKITPPGLPLPPEKDTDVITADCIRASGEPDSTAESYAAASISWSPVTTRIVATRGFGGPGHYSAAP